MASTARKGAAALSVLFSLLAGCTPAPVVTSTQCTFSSECAAPLVCTDGRCQVECHTDRDCPTDYACLSVGLDGLTMCVSAAGGDAGDAGDASCGPDAVHCGG